MVDSVQEVIRIEPEQITPPPRMGADINNAFVKGMGSLEDGFIVLLNIDQIFAADAAVTLQGTEESDTTMTVPQGMDIVSEVTV